MTIEHQIIWNELHSSDVEASAAFYGALFGWAIREEERETYLHFYASADSDETVAGLMPAHPGAPVMWQVYVGTEDIEAYAKRAEAAGAKAVTPLMDIPHTGRLQVLLDKEGASLAPFQPSKMDHDSWRSSEEPGRFCWVELLTRDHAAQVDFYKSIVGWETLDMDMGEFTYTLFVPPGGDQQDSIGGAMPMPAGVGGPSVWLAYVTVESCDASTARARELGATIHQEPRNVGDFGRFAVLDDPGGATIAIYEKRGC
jgi:predicted enzyme related to lactoylglutathione lyase